MNTIFTTLYGSHLFGCAVPGSDADFKSVHLENLKELLFKDTHAFQEKVVTEEKKIETESYSLRFYLQLLAKGQVIATDMFFSPESFWRGSDPVWRELKELEPHIITRNIAPFAGYANSQALKYGTKGLKLQTIQKAIELLEYGFPFDAMLSEMAGMEGFSLEIKENPGGPIRHLNICGKCYGETTDPSIWLKSLTKFEATFGKRSRDSKEGTDLKAQYHAVRICAEAKELLTTGTITFPRPEAPLLLKIRRDEFDADALRALIDSSLEELDASLASSPTPEDVNWPKIEDFIYCAERDHLRHSM